MAHAREVASLRRSIFPSEHDVQAILGPLFHRPEKQVIAASTSSTGGHAVYGTRPGPLEPVDGVWGMTHAGDRAFLFVNAWPAAELALPALPRRVLQVKNLSGQEVAWRSGPEGLKVSVEPQDRGQPVTVLEMVMASS